MFQEKSFLLPSRSTTSIKMIENFYVQYASLGQVPGKLIFKF